jgi:hypothetical protein
MAAGLFISLSIAVRFSERIPAKDNTLIFADC